MTHPRPDTLDAVLAHRGGTSFTALSSPSTRSASDGARTVEDYLVVDEEGTIWAACDSFARAQVVMQALTDLCAYRMYNEKGQGRR